MNGTAPHTLRGRKVTPGSRTTSRPSGQCTKGKRDATPGSGSQGAAGPVCEEVNRDANEEVVTDASRRNYRIGDLTHCRWAYEESLLEDVMPPSRCAVGGGWSVDSSPYGQKRRTQMPCGPSSSWTKCFFEVKPSLQLGGYGSIQSSTTLNV